MKVKLLNNGGFFGMELVEFPVEVEAVFYDRNPKAKAHYKVSSSGLFRVGSSRGSFHEGGEYNFLIEEVEVIS